MLNLQNTSHDTSSVAAHVGAHVGSHLGQLHPASLMALLEGTPAPSFASMAHIRGRVYAGPERRCATSITQRRMAQMLDTIDYGMLLMADAQKVAHLNKAALRDLDDTHPLQLVGATLQARHSHDSARLREALVGASQRGLRRLLQLGPQGGDGGQCISVAVVPLPALGSDSPFGAALLLGRRQVCEELTVDWFARSNQLTMAETAVMKCLCRDLTPQQIAVHQGVGLATIRTQIGSIRLKTGATSIRALMRQVALLPPLVGVLQARHAVLHEGLSDETSAAPAVALAASSNRGGNRALHS